MNNHLPEIIKETEAITQKAASLTEKLKAMPVLQTEIVLVGVDPLVFAVTIFTLSCFIGYYVVWKVTPSLHTPLMSLTNAISAIIIIGALISAGSSEISLSSILGFIAVFFASINISGGFIVTERMLEMFKKKSK
ncbi:MAG: NAD(P) transhydrogenase subunit alpha [Rickettsiaceae bacterium]|nr:NAD(P) transhydrogenase subunit alpha [Rickettsiaceae bacterium]